MKCFITTILLLLGVFAKGQDPHFRNLNGSWKAINGKGPSLIINTGYWTVIPVNDHEKDSADYRAEIEYLTSDSKNEMLIRNLVTLSNEHDTLFFDLDALINDTLLLMHDMQQNIGVAYRRMEVEN